MLGSSKFSPFAPAVFAAQNELARIDPIRLAERTRCTVRVWQGSLFDQLFDLRQRTNALPVVFVVDLLGVVAKRDGEFIVLDFLSFLKIAFSSVNNLLVLLFLNEPVKKSREFLTC